MTSGVDTHRDIVVIGGSAGALDPLKQIASDLPADLHAAVIVCIHMASTANTMLAAILNRAGGMRAVTPRDGDPLKPGYLYVPTPDYHVELTADAIRLTKGPRVNGMRPAVDVLFRSAAKAFGPRVVGVILSGGLDDGSAGLAAIHAAGGVGIVQSRDDALVDSMPKNAIELAAPRHVLKAEEIGAAIVEMVGAAAKPERAEHDKGGFEMEAVGALDTPGQVTGMTCPDCHGSIWLQRGEGGEVAMTCRVGHSYSPESFFEIQSENVENALWAGLRSLEEQSTLAGVMASRAEKFKDEAMAERYKLRSRVASEHADVLRKLLLDKDEDVA